MSTTPARDYPSLENFFSAYFHQDWSLEHDRPEAVVDYYRDSEPGPILAQTRAELRALLARDLDEAALAATVRALGAEYVPDADHGGYRGWLAAIAARLEA